MSEADALCFLVEQWRERLMILTDRAKVLEHKLATNKNEVEELVLNSDMEQVEDEMQDIIEKLTTIITMTNMDTTQEQHEPSSDPLPLPTCTPSTAEQPPHQSLPSSALPQADAPQSTSDPLPSS